MSKNFQENNAISLLIQIISDDTIKDYDINAIEGWILSLDKQQINSTQFSEMDDGCDEDEDDFLDMWFCEDTFLTRAVQGRRVDIVEKLLMHPDIDISVKQMSSYGGRNAKMLAEGCPEILQLLDDFQNK
eukprot:TRINITY_DN1020_c0_g1_i2.p1 TRINITY_DN1020_c0_g1~~TRINITY_DN1020_c0_g1_i2.p1  ORF type:complete len:130 (+),score=45.75 TRINITY_DN1020_c0_g1_i2:98-487(+)